MSERSILRQHQLEECLLDMGNPGQLELIPGSMATDLE